MTTPDDSYDDISRLVLEENVLGKRTLSSRVNTLRRLREFYALRPEIPLYSALRFFWNLSPEEQPMLAVLCAATRDPVLCASAETILGWPTGTAFRKQELEERLRSVYPGRYSTVVLEAMVRRLLSSWTQSGHLKGRSTKIRTRAVSGPASTAYALFLGYLTGLRGNALFDTVWVRILDTPPAEVHRHAFEASKRGWIDYKRAGDIVEVGFSGVSGAEKAL